MNSSTHVVDMSVYIFLIPLLVCSGCQQSIELAAGPPPADFKLQLCIREKGDFSLQGATYIVEPDGTLRAATGPGCTLQTFPGPTTKITPIERQLVYDAARKIDFQNASADKPRSELYSGISVVAYANGQRRRVDQYYLLNCGLSFPAQVEVAFDLESLLSTLSRRTLIENDQ